jgi:hypothetical protein
MDTFYVLHSPAVIVGIFSLDKLVIGWHAFAGKKKSGLVSSICIYINIFFISACVCSWYVHECRTTCLLVFVVSLLSVSVEGCLVLVCFQLVL